MLVATTICLILWEKSVKHYAVKEAILVGTFQAQNHLTPLATAGATGVPMRGKTRREELQHTF